MHNLTTPIELRRPALVHYGSGTLSKLADWVAEGGYKAPFVVADPINAARLDALGLGTVACFGDVVPEPGSDNLDKAVAAATGADLVIGFGGGSAMDLAKLVAVMVGQDVDLGDISGPNRAPARKVGLVQIPTTAGTGSEVGTRALVTDPATNSKIATESPHMLADIAIIDPDLTMTVPAHVTAATGVDAMAHCVEAYTSKRAHPLIDGYALQGIELVGRYLKRAVDNGDDAEARARLTATEATLTQTRAAHDRLQALSRSGSVTEANLEAARADYTSGEVIAPGLLHCVHCESTTTLTRPSVLEPCHACGHRFFSRGAPPVTRQPPAADESDQG